jgi:hypothetical protein
MSYDNQIKKILEDRRQIRARERAFRREFNKENNMGLMEQIKGLPARMQPSNVGNIDKVTWPFWFSLTFDFGTNPTYGPNTKLVQSFQVSNEAAYLLGAIGRKAWDSTNAGDLAPLQIEFRDRQSSRQFNDRPVPLQNIGKKYQYTELPTPMLIAPNAFFEATITSWLLANQASVGNGKHEINFYGYRIRAEDMKKTYSAIFG